MQLITPDQAPLFEIARRAYRAAPVGSAAELRAFKVMGRALHPATATPGRWAALCAARRDLQRAYLEHAKAAGGTPSRALWLELAADAASLKRLTARFALDTLHEEMRGC